MTAELAPTNNLGTPSNPRYPGVRVRLTGTDGNAYSIMAACSAAARKAGVTDAEIKGFVTEAKSGDYDALLRTCMRWFDVC